jgi:hypothetical protein
LGLLDGSFGFELGRVMDLDVGNSFCRFSFVFGLFALWGAFGKGVIIPVFVFVYHFLLFWVLASQLFPMFNTKGGNCSVDGRVVDRCVTSNSYARCLAENYTRGITRCVLWGHKIQ